MNRPPEEFILTTTMGSFDYTRNMRQYERVVSQEHERRTETRVFEDLEPNVIVPPQPVQILCRGIIRAAGQSWDVRVNEYVIGARSLGRSVDDDLLFTLAQVDFIAAPRVVLPLHRARLRWHCG
jgi:hypothetical protein